MDNFKNNNIDKLIKEYENSNFERLTEIINSKTNVLINSIKGNLEVRTFSSIDSPELMVMIGYLRERAFRESGGGTGERSDIDEYDLGNETFEPFQQLIVLQKIDDNGKTFLKPLGAYRYQLGNKLISQNGELFSPTGSLFDFSDEFKREILPHSIELGRSIVYPIDRTTIFALNGLIHGLGALIFKHEKDYFFGKITRFPEKDKKTRNIVDSFLNQFYIDNHQSQEMKDYMSSENPIEGDYLVEEDLKGKNIGYLKQKIEEILLKESLSNQIELPPMYSNYAKLANHMEIYTTAINTHFANLPETGLLISAKDFKEEAINKYIISYINQLKKQKDIDLKSIEDKEKRFLEKY